MDFLLVNITEVTLTKPLSLKVKNQTPELTKDGEGESTAGFRVWELLHNLLEVIYFSIDLLGLLDLYRNSHQPCLVMVCELLECPTAVLNFHHFFMKYSPFHRFCRATLTSASVRTVNLIYPLPFRCKQLCIS